MLSSQVYSSCSATKGPLEEQCRLQGGLRSLNTERKASVVKFQKSISHSSLKLAALASNLSNIKHQLSFSRCLASTLEHEEPSNFEADHEPKSSNFSSQLHAFWRFCRPHTIIGTVLGITSVSLLTVETRGDLSFTFFLGVLKAMVSAVLMNIYVVGLNQLYDVEIDKINKPDLPLASGEFSMGTGAAIVASASCMSFTLGFMFQSPALLWALLICFLIGSIYSLDFPSLRWKRYPFLAASSILTVRAFVLQIAFFIHIQKYILGRPIFFPRSFVFGTASVCLFSAVIALFKDIPDVDGDRDFGIQSFSICLGQEKIFWFCISILFTVYGIATVVGATSQCMPSMLVTVFGHCTLAFILWLRARTIDLTDKESLTSFYMFIWKLFYMEYFLIPFVR